MGCTVVAFVIQCVVTSVSDSSSVLLLVPPLLVLFVLQRGAQLLDEHRQHLVQRVHHPPLQPLGNCSPGVVEAQFLQDVVHTHRVDLTPCPGDEPEERRRKGSV